MSDTKELLPPGDTTLSIFNQFLQKRYQNVSYGLFLPTSYSLLTHLTSELSYAFPNLFEFFGTPYGKTDLCHYQFVYLIFTPLSYYLPLWDDHF